MKKVAVSIVAAMPVSLLASPVGSASYNFTPLTYPGATITGAYGNNDLGQVVGEYFVPGDPYPKGFIYEAGNPRRGQAYRVI